MSTTTLTTGAKALAQRLKYRRLPDVPVPTTKDPELARALEGVKEHLRMYEGDTGAPKERFVSIQELEDSGLITADVKNKFAFIAQVQGQDVVQAAGTADKTIRTTVVNNNTSSGATSLSDLSDADAAGSANDAFLMYAGSEYSPYFLFKADNDWTGVQSFTQPPYFQEQSAGPSATAGLGYLWSKAGSPNTLWFTADDGTETQLGAGGGGPTFVGFELAGGTILTQQEMRNTGADTSVNVHRMIWDPIGLRLIIGGDLAYIGSKTLVTDKLVQAPTIPASATDAHCMAIDNTTEGVVWLSNTKVMELSDSDLDNWTVITPPTVTVQGVFTMDTTIDDNIYAPFDELATPQRNIAVSTDQGSTWDIATGEYAPITDDPMAVVTSRGRTLVAVMAQAGGGVAITDDPTGTWYLHTTASTFDITHGAFSDDDTTFVCVDTEGKIFVVDTPLATEAAVLVDIASNPFQQTSVLGATFDFVSYVPQIGFLFGALADNVVGRIALTDLTLCEQGLYLGGSVALAGLNMTTPGLGALGAVDASGNFQWGTTGNETVIFLDPDA